jgi:hypothetical protein
VVAEITYQKIGLPVTDSTRIGLYFQSGVRPIQTLTISNHEFIVPPGEWNYGVDATRKLDRELTLLSITPSMRRLGMEIRIAANLPDGTSEVLLWVRDYDYRRKKAYELKSPKRLPAGTQISISAQFNNSESNAALPPGEQKAVQAGTAAQEEELAVFLEYVDGTL